MLSVSDSPQQSKEDVSPNNDLRANPSPSAERSFFAWFDKNDGPVERSLILKLDFYILSFACMGFWVSQSRSLSLTPLSKMLTWLAGHVYRSRYPFKRLRQWNERG